MSVVQRGKQAQWPPATAPSTPGRTRSAGTTLPGRAAVEREAALRWLETRDGGRSTAWFRRVVRAVWNRCNHLNAPVVYPWSPSRRGTERVHRLHRLAAGLTRKYYGRGWVRLWLWTKAWLWPLIATSAILPLLWRCGRRVRTSRNLPLAVQTRDLFSAVWRHGIFPTEYYHHRIFRMGPERDRANYLNEREIRALLLECVRNLDADRINDLPRFFGECRAAGLPVPRVAAVVGASRAGSETSPAEALPPRDLFLRPASAEGTIAGQHWRWNAQARAWMFRGETRAAPALLEHAARLARAQPWIIHEAVSNHPDIARLSAGGVCTAHIATALDEEGCPHVLFAAMHLPASADGGWGPAPGELVAGIEPSSGRMGVAMDEFVSDGEFPVHPGTGVMIEDAIVPQWTAMADLALRAHRSFPDLPFVGWRIALTGGGPLLVDANTDWGVFRHVWPAETAFAPCCERRLAQLAQT